MQSNKVFRALVLSPTPTWPLNYGNRKRIFSVCSELKKLGYEVHFVHYASEADWRNNIPIESRKMMDDQWDMVDHVMPSKPLHDWPKKGEDHEIDEWWDWAIESHLKKLFEVREYDLFLVNYTWLSKALSLAPSNCYTVLDTHDKFSGRRELLEQNKISKEFFHTTESEELVALDRADLVWAIKEQEKDDFLRMGTTAAVETMLHIDERRISQSVKATDKLVFGFVGANNSINKVNFCRFVEIAERIFVNHLPPLTVVVAGSICKGLETVNSPYFEKIGYVEDINSFYDSIDVAIVPMEFSTGLKIKVAEGLSQSKPLMSHVHAMEGFPITHDFHKCEDFEDFALKMVELSYEPDMLADLQVATEKSFELIQSDIQSSFTNLNKQVKNHVDILIIYPKAEYLKYEVYKQFVESKVDWLSWKYKNILKFCVDNEPEHFIYDTNLRFISEVQLQAVLSELSPNLIVNFNDMLSLGEGLNVLDLSGNSTEQSKNSVRPVYYANSIDPKYFPALGHKNVELVEDLDKEKRFATLCIGEKSDWMKKLYKDVQFITIEHPADLDNAISKWNIPEKLIVNKLLSNTNQFEQLYLDVCLKYKAEIIDLNIANSLFEINSSKDYEGTFFPVWKQFERNVVARLSGQIKL